MPTTKIIAALIAVLVGGLGARLAAPHWAAHRALTAITSADPAERETAWRWWLARADTRPAADRLAPLRARLVHGSDDALLHGADALRAAGLWTWAEPPDGLTLRELELRIARADAAEWLLAAETLRDTPADTDAERLRTIVDTLLARTPDPAAAAAFAAACGWAGPERAAWLETLTLPRHATRLRHLRHLALTWTPASTTPAVTPADAATESRPVREARRPPEAIPAGRPSIATILAVERMLDRPRAVDLAETWIRSFADDEKRAGALLAALLDAHPDLLRRAYEIEDVGAVRTTQRLALWAMAPADDASGRELLHRTLHREDGDVRDEAALCLLIAGAPDGLALLTRLPAGNAIEAMARRHRLVERFVPAWSATLGASPPEDPAAGRLLFDRLEARRLLTARRTRFDPTTRTYDDGLPASQPTTATGEASASTDPDACSSIRAAYSRSVPG